jgi:succinyl-CoA synthetase alpha subunit
VSIFVNKETKLLVQGITGKEGQFHTRAVRCLRHPGGGRRDPGKGGQKMDDVPVFNTVSDAVKNRRQLPA